MKKSKFLLSAILVAIAATLAVVCSFALFTDSASMAFSIKTSKITGSMSVDHQYDSNSLIFANTDAPYYDSFGMEAGQRNPLNYKETITFTNDTTQDEYFTPVLTLESNVDSNEAALLLYDLKDIQACTPRTLKYTTMTGDYLSLTSYLPDASVNQLATPKISHSNFKSGITNGKTKYEYVLPKVLVPAGQTVTAPYFPVWIFTNDTGTCDYFTKYEAYYTCTITQVKASLWSGDATVTPAATGKTHSYMPAQQSYSESANFARMMSKLNSYVYDGTEKEIQWNTDAQIDDVAVNDKVSVSQIYKKNSDGTYEPVDKIVDAGDYKWVFTVAAETQRVIPIHESYLTWTGTVNPIEITATTPEDKIYDGLPVETVVPDVIKNDVTITYYEKNDDGSQTKLPSAPSDTGNYLVVVEPATGNVTGKVEKEFKITKETEPILRVHSWGDTKDFMANKSTIQTISFFDKEEDVLAEKNSSHAEKGPWDVSYNNDGSVMAWQIGNDVYIVGNGKGYIYMPADASNWFNSMTSLVSINGMDIIDTSKATDMRDMFYQCNALTTVDVSHFDTSNVKYMTSMFSFCRALTNLDISNFKTNKVIYMNSMFSWCSSLTSLNLGNIDTSNATTFNYMFNGCSSLPAIDVSSFNTSKVTNMEGMFSNCSSLPEIDVSNFDTSHVSSLRSMFSSCRKLQTLDLSNFNTTNAQNVASMFRWCSDLKTVNMTGWDVSKVYSFAYLFDGCSSLTEIDLSEWGDTGYTGFDNERDMQYMFSSCSSLKSLDVSPLKTDKITNMKGMFKYDSGLTVLDVSGFDMSAVEDISEMFASCRNLQSVNVSGWDTQNVTNMSSTFTESGSLTELDLSSWNTSNVTTMRAMFNYDSKLKTVYVSGLWNSAHVTDSMYMFTDCNSLVGGNGTKWNSSYDYLTYARIDTADAPGYFTAKESTLIADENSENSVEVAELSVDQPVKKATDETAEKAVSETAVENLNSPAPSDQATNSNDNEAETASDSIVEISDADSDVDLAA